MGEFIARPHDRFVDLDQPGEIERRAGNHNIGCRTVDGLGQCRHLGRAVADGRKRAPEFEAWLQRMGITDAAGEVLPPPARPALADAMARLLESAP